MMMLVTGPVYGADPVTGVYRGPLRVQTINAEIRPTKVSRIISIRIIEILLSASSAGPGSTPGFPV
jgi:hypothetical protein